VGFDLHSEVQRAQTIDSAMSLGVATATDRIELVDLQGVYSSILLQPLYRDSAGELSTSRATDSSTLGFVYSMLVYDQFLSKALLGVQLPALVDVLLLDPEAPVGQQYLGHYCSAASPDCPYSFTKSASLVPADMVVDDFFCFTLPLLDQNLELRVVARVGFYAGQVTNAPMVLFLISLAGAVFGNMPVLIPLAYQRCKQSKWDPRASRVYIDLAQAQPP
jgi:hypothetical protein